MISVAPAWAQASATPVEIDFSLAMPVMRPTLPSRLTMGVMMDSFSRVSVVAAQRQRA